MSSGSHPRSSTEASNKRKASAKPTSSPSAIPEVAIAPQQKPQRLLALMREHEQLLAKIKQKQSETSRLGRRIATAIAVAHQEAKPILEKTARLKRQIHDLFAELLAREGQPHGERTTVQLMYTYLEATGQLSPAEQRRSEQETSHREDSEKQIPPGASGGVSAKRPAESPTASTLRALFHRLAAAMHPDKVQDTHQKAERTEVMKELTQAFQAGDLARLLMLEREWLAAKYPTTWAEFDPLWERITERWRDAGPGVESGGFAVHAEEILGEKQVVDAIAVKIGARDRLDAAEVAALGLGVEHRRGVVEQVDEEAVVVVLLGHREGAVAELVVGQVLEDGVVGHARNLRRSRPRRSRWEPGRRAAGRSARATDRPARAGGSPVRRTGRCQHWHRRHSSSR